VPRFFWQLGFPGIPHKNDDDWGMVQMALLFYPHDSPISSNLEAPLPFSFTSQAMPAMIPDVTHSMQVSMFYSCRITGEGSKKNK